MAVPDFQSIMLPLLAFLQDGQERSIREAVNYLADQFKLTENDLNELIPSGKQTRFYNRVLWARTYLSKSGLIDIPKKSYCKISQKGIMVLQQNPKKIDMKFLEQFPEYLEFKKLKHHKAVETKNKQNGSITEETPEEILEDAYQEIRENLVQDLVAQMKSCSPAFFEQLLIDLLVKMGYGGSRRDAARAVGQSGDGGIDGIIDEDRLGLDSIYIQAKRWDGVVGRPEIQKFVGALMGKHAKKGIFITTSKFSSDALHFRSMIDYRIILIDGQRLAELMIDHNIGVTEVTSYSLKRIDSDYFMG